MKKRAVVVFPGRGVYAGDELGYLSKHHAANRELVEFVDGWRAERGREAVSALDSRSRYVAGVHASSENASAIIYTCALSDFGQIDREKFEIVAITGNSLGWYLALAGAGVLQRDDAIKVVDDMGQLMAGQGQGGQIVASLVDADWRRDPEKAEQIEHALESAREEGGRAEWSIRLGGTAVLGGDEKGLTALEKLLPKEPPFPFRLARHSAFHTSLLEHIPEPARDMFSSVRFHKPEVALVDGRGAVWREWHSDPDAMRDYTFGHQLVKPYDFSAAIRTCLREFAPDVFILTGPGSNLGGAIAQTIIAEGLWSWKDKQSFLAEQKTNPRLLSMGIDNQRRLVVAD